MKTLTAAPCTVTFGRKILPVPIGTEIELLNIPEPRWVLTVAAATKITGSEHDATHRYFPIEEIPDDPDQ